MDGLLLRPAVLLLALALIAAEMAWRKARARGYDFGAAAASLGIAAGNLVAKALGAGVVGTTYLAAGALAPAALPLDDWRIWLAGFLIVEFLYYWFHRFSHTVRWLWATHAVHHSAEELTLPAGLRLGWTGLVSGGWLFFVPLALVGFPPLMISALLAFNLVYQFLLHTEAVGRLRPLEWVLNTPAHHRVHHASNAAYLDRNFGGVVIIFDRLFGSFADERPGLPLRYGLVHGLSSKNPFVIAFHEWRRVLADMRKVRSPRALAGALFGRP